jgi:hypothetical protein
VSSNCRRIERNGRLKRSLKIPLSKFQYTLVDLLVDCFLKIQFYGIFFFKYWREQILWLEYYSKKPILTLQVSFSFTWLVNSNGLQKNLTLYVIHPKKKKKKKSDFPNIFIIMCWKARPSQETSNVSVTRNCPIDNVINDLTSSSLYVAILIQSRIMYGAIFYIITPDI